eukprot:COSAG02_NODE_2580_length_8493_cov_3.138432_7_plen_1283_part_00
MGAEAPSVRRGKGRTGSGKAKAASVPLLVQQGSAEHKYLKHFDDWEKAVNLTFQLGLAVAVSKLDVGEGVLGLNALMRLVRTLTGGKPVCELDEHAQPALCANCRAPLDSSSMRMGLETVGAEEQQRQQQRERTRPSSVPRGRVSAESDEWFPHPGSPAVRTQPGEQLRSRPRGRTTSDELDGTEQQRPSSVPRGRVSAESDEWFPHPGSPAVRTQPGEQLRFRPGGFSTASAEFDGKDFAVQQRLEHSARLQRQAKVVGATPPWIDHGAEDDDGSTPWGIGQRIKPKRATRKAFDVPPPGRTYGAPTPAFDGVGMQGQYLRGAPGGPPPATAPERPWALDPEATDMFTEAEKQREEEKARADYMRLYHRQEQEQEQEQQQQQQQHDAGEHAEQRHRQPGEGEHRPHVSWAKDKDKVEVIDPSWHDSYAEHPYYADGEDRANLETMYIAQGTPDEGSRYPDDLGEPPELVQEPLTPDDNLAFRDDYNDDEAPDEDKASREQLCKTGRVVVQPDGRRVWGPVQSISPERERADERQQQPRHNTSQAKAKANEAAARARVRQAERDQKAREEHERRMRSAAVKASRDKTKQAAAKLKADKIRKNPWRATAAKPYSTFPNPYDNGPQWRETLRQLDDNDAPSRDILERRAAQQRRAASAERRARNRADQAQWDAPPASGGPPDPNPYEDPVAWVETLRDSVDTAAVGPEGTGDTGRHEKGKMAGGSGSARVVPMQPTSQFRRSVEAESKIAAQVRADKELYKARLKQARSEERGTENPAHPGGTFSAGTASRDAHWHSGGFPDQPVPAEFYDPAGMEAAAAAAAGPIGQIETMWEDADTAARTAARGSGDDESELPPWKLVEKYLPEYHGRDAQYGYNHAAAHGRGDNLYPTGPTHLYPGGPPAPQRRTAASHFASSEQNCGVAQMAAHESPEQVKVPTVGGETGDKIVEGTQPQAQLHQEQTNAPSLYPAAVRLKVDAAQLRHAADSQAALEAREAAEAAYDTDTLAAREETGRQGEGGEGGTIERRDTQVETVQGQQQQQQSQGRGREPPTSAAEESSGNTLMGRITKMTSTDEARGTDDVRIGTTIPVVHGDGGSVEAPPVLTSNDLDSMEARMRSLQESISRGQEQHGDTSEDEVAATAPPPLAARARAAAAMMDLDSSIETAAADESFTGPAAAQDRLASLSDRAASLSPRAAVDSNLDSVDMSDSDSDGAVVKRDIGAKTAISATSLESRTLSMASTTTKTTVTSAETRDSNVFADRGGHEGGILLGPVCPYLLHANCH